MYVVKNRDRITILELIKLIDSEVPKVKYIFYRFSCPIGYTFAHFLSRVQRPVWCPHFLNLYIDTKVIAYLRGQL